MDTPGNTPLLKLGDQVRFRPQTMLWNNHRKAIGTIIKVYVLPANGMRVDVEWDSGDAPAFGLPLDLLSPVSEPLSLT